MGHPSTCVRAPTLNLAPPCRAPAVPAIPAARLLCLTYLPLAGSTQLARTCTVSSLLFCRLMLATLATPTSITLAMVSMHIESESAAQVYARCVRAAIKTANERRPRDVQPQQSNSGAAAEKQWRSSAQQAEVVCTGR
jgi:hypothetical protein